MLVCNPALGRQVLAIVTAPLHKESLAAAGFSYPGHTDCCRPRPQRTSITRSPRYPYE